MQNYLNALANIMQRGVDRDGRNGTTRAVFPLHLSFDLQEGFPAPTTKRLAFRAVLGELLWFLEGSGDDNRLQQIMGKPETIWTANAHSSYWKGRADFDGDLGRIYGKQWRDWQSPSRSPLDQIAVLVQQLQHNPTSRRHVVTAWNPGELDKMALPPCHMIWQCFVAGGRLSMHMFQRSGDMFLGVPFDIASYAILTHMLAQVTGLEPGSLSITIGDAHIYHAHFDAVGIQLARTPSVVRPELWLNPDITDLFKFTMADVELRYYAAQDPIPALMIV